MLEPEDVRLLVEEVKAVFNRWTKKDIGMDASDVLATFAALTHAYAPLIGVTASSVFRNNAETAEALELVEDMEKDEVH